MRRTNKDDRRRSSPVIDVHGLPKPMLRGRIHLLAFLVSLPAGFLLVDLARPGAGRTGAVIYASSLTALYGASAAYHRLGRSPVSQRWLRRIDHATIYLLIAGTYTPVCLLVLEGAWRWSLLAAVWSAAALGVGMKLLRFDMSQRWGSYLYAAMGGAVVVVLPQLVTRMPLWVFGLLATGGLVYSVGALVLATRRPNPFPRVFGYHEVWHCMVVVAGICHWTVVFHVVRAPAF